MSKMKWLPLHWVVCNKCGYETERNEDVTYLKFIINKDKGIFRNNYNKCPKCKWVDSLIINSDEEKAEPKKKEIVINESLREYKKEFKQNRKIVLAIDNYKCRECNSKDKLHVHHIEEKSKGGSNDINNLITLCSDCHKEKHKDENVYHIM